jgi:hypothetical protein
LNHTGASASVLSRAITFDFVLSTSAFRAMTEALRPAIHAVQLRKTPPDHLDLGKISGKERYRLLSEAGWYFEFSTPGNDFGQLLAPSRGFLESFLANPSLDFANLP